MPFFLLSRVAFTEILISASRQLGHSVYMCWPHASYAKMAELIDIAFVVAN